MVDPSILKTVEAYLREIEAHGIPVSFGVLFGSQARGTADRHSDVDVMVVSPVFDEGRDREQVSLLRRLASRLRSRIEPIPCGERQWREDDGTPIIEVARREGLPLYIHGVPA
jgi:predicted nucleotidyltransferase